MKTLFVGLLGIALTGLLCATGFANEMPFNQKTFDDLRSSGKPVVAYIHADWCSTCKAQRGVLSQLLADPEFKNLTVLTADFDTEEALLDALKVTRQSTFVVFKGSREVGRSTGDTRKDSIAALFRKSL